MPEFILDHGSPESAKTFRALDSFTQGYIEAMFFTSEGPDSDCEPGHENDMVDLTVADLAPVTLEHICTDCGTFQMAHAELLERAYQLGDAQMCYDESRAGNDYWYSRNGHGTGYWDRGLGEVGDELHKASRYHELNLYRGDDGLIYLA